MTTPKKDPLNAPLPPGARERLQPDPDAKSPFEALLEAFNRLSDQVDSLDLAIDERLTRLENFSVEVKEVLESYSKAFEALDLRLKDLEAWRKR